MLRVARAYFGLAKAEYKTVAAEIRSRFQGLFEQQPPFALAGISQMPQSASEADSSSIFDNWVWFAAPKSKISPSRKKQKHMRMFPEKVAWVKCSKCGEPKRPHRMCTENLEVCAMRPEEYEEYMKRKMAERAAASSD